MTKLQFGHKPFKAHEWHSHVFAYFPHPVFGQTDSPRPKQSTQYRRLEHLLTPLAEMRRGGRLRRSQLGFIEPIVLRNHHIQHTLRHCGRHTGPQQAILEIVVGHLLETNRLAQHFGNDVRHVIERHVLGTQYGHVVVTAPASVQQQSWVVRPGATLPEWPTQRRIRALPTSRGMTTSYLCFDHIGHLAKSWLISLNALNSRALPQGSNRNIVACSPTCPLKRI